MTATQNATRSLILVTGLALPATGGETTLNPRDTLPAAGTGRAWKLVWHDEFDGTTLDKRKWEVPEYKRRDAWWTRRAVVLDGTGHLVLKIFKEDGKYFDGCARTRGRFEHAFGYYVARMKLQSQPGHWTAFWLYNRSVGTVGDAGRDGTEIDIMEKPWLDERVQHTLHWDGYSKKHHRHKGRVAKVPGVMTGWHTFGLKWTPEAYVFSVDGRETWRTTAGGVCRVPLYIKLSDEAKMKGWAGNLRDAKLPDECLVDYVRVYDLVDEKTGAPVYPVPAGSINRAGRGK